MSNTASPFDNITLKDIPSILPLLSQLEQEKLLAELEQLNKLKKKKRAQTKFIDFVKQMWPTFISGKHHARMAAAFERVAKGESKRLIINMPPRHTKSEFASYLLPAWFLGQYPHKKVIQTSHTAELAVGFGRKVRNLVDQESYKEIFPDLHLSADSKAAGRWNTSKCGDYFAIGVGGAVTGKGADLLIIDDPHSEQEAALAEINPDVYDKTYEWYTSGPRQRLQPGGAIVIVMTRWSLRDLTAKVIKSSAQRGGDEWEVIEFPALMPSGTPLWPEFWSKTELSALKEELPNAKWMAQYQQQPTSETSAIVKREWWQTWEHEDMPNMQYVIQSYDTAFSKSETADFFDTNPDSDATFEVHPDAVGKINTVLQFSLLGSTLLNEAFMLGWHEQIETLWWIVGTTTIVSGVRYGLAFLRDGGAYKGLTPKKRRQASKS